MNINLKNRVEALKNKKLSREQEDMNLPNDGTDTVEDISTDELIETNEKMDDFVEEDNNIEAIDRQIDNAQEEAEVMADDIESTENPSDTEVTVASERLFMFKYANGLANFRLASESAKLVYSKDNKEAMKRIAREFRKAGNDLEIAREGIVGDKLGDWIYSLFNFGKKRFPQVKRELLKGKIVDNFGKLDEANKILVTKSLYNTVIHLVYILKFFGKSDIKVSKDIKGMLKNLKLDVKELSSIVKDIFEELRRIQGDIINEHPIASKQAKATDNGKEDRTIEALSDLIKSIIKAYSRGKVAQTLADKHGDALVAIKQTFGETFAKYTLDEYLAQNKGNIDEIVRSLNLEDAMNIESDIRYIVEDIFDIYDYTWDYIFDADYGDISFIWSIMDMVDRETCKVIRKIFSIIGNIKQRIHTDIYDAFITLRKV